MAADVRTLGREEDAVVGAEELLADGAFTVKAAAEFSGLSRTELFNAIADGELISLKRGKRRLIPKRALVRLLAKGLDQ